MVLCGKLHGRVGRCQGYFLSLLQSGRRLTLIPLWLFENKNNKPFAILKKSFAKNKTKLLTIKFAPGILETSLKKEL